jgi:hypothetical protein
LAGYSVVIRVFYVDLCPSPGGSNISLLHLVSHLDRRQVQPLVALAAVNPFTRFEEAGIPVVRVHTPRWERQSANLKVAHGSHGLHGSDSMIARAGPLTERVVFLDGCAPSAWMAV